MTSAPAGTPKFTEGSIMRHVVVMTATGTIGLMAIFVVDVLNLYYIARLGRAELAAAIGYAGTLLFFATSIGIGLAIGATAVVSRALGARETGNARRMAASALVITTLVVLVLSLAILPFLPAIVAYLGATGETARLAERFLFQVMPATPLLALGMVLSGLLRAEGDATRAMHVTLSAAIAAAILDPILILWLDLGLDGAAIASIVSRLVMAAVGFYGVAIVHKLVKRPNLPDMLRDAAPIAAIAVPAVLTNIATPIGNAFVTAAIAPFGDDAVAAWAVIGRIIPLAFGAVFALSGSVGPIIGQNLGARRFDRVRRVLMDSVGFTAAYCLAVWAVLAFSAEPLARLFGLAGDGIAMVRFFCQWLTGLFIFTGALFVANAAFNNLGAPLYSTLFNWGRATLGTIPFVWFGAQHWGANGVLAAQQAGGVMFGAVAVFVAFRVAARVEREGVTSSAPPLSAVADAPLASGKGAGIIGTQAVRPSDT
jgi:putative MATE family efflux protein